MKIRRGISNSGTWQTWINARNNIRDRKQREIFVRFERATVDIFIYIDIYTVTNTSSKISPQIINEEGKN